MKNQPALDGIDLSPIIVGDVEKRSNTIGFWHHFAGGRGTHSDQIIKKLKQAIDQWQDSVINSLNGKDYKKAKTIRR